jgi:hypothetical protein
VGRGRLKGHAAHLICKVGGREVCWDIAEASGKLQVTGCPGTTQDGLEGYVRVLGQHLGGS